MKKLTLIFIILFITLNHSSYSKNRWVKIYSDEVGTEYIDIQNIKKNNGYIFFWNLTNVTKPYGGIYYSANVYKQVDCKIFRVKRLVFHWYKKSNGSGTYKSEPPKNKDWIYPSPNSVEHGNIEYICKNYF